MGLSRRFSYSPWFMSLSTLVLVLSLVVPTVPLMAEEATPEATPPAVALPNGFTSMLLASVPVEYPPGTVVGYFDTVALTLAPGAAAPQSHAHSGTFFLSVISGTICFTDFGVLDPRDTVTARVPADARPGTGSCSENVSDDCTDMDGCTLEAGDMVELPAGSTIVQTGAAGHTYGNADATNEAVLHLSGFSPPPDGAPCVGGCWGW